MISTNGSSSIVWALDLHAYTGGTPDGTINTPGPAVLHAYDGSTLHELYNSTQAGTRDRAGNALKFTSPTVANGHVYVGTANQLMCMGCCLRKQSPHRRRRALRNKDTTRISYDLRALLR
jgi:hypothetical protein